MNKKEAFKESAEVFDSKLPSRVAGFSVSPGGVLLVAAHDHDVCIVVYTKPELERLRSMCEVALRSFIPPEEVRPIEPQDCPRPRPPRRHPRRR
jgi:hypothetical protein